MTIMWYLAILSFFGFFLSLWFRDRERKALCQAADAFMRESPSQNAWLATYDALLHSTAQMNRVALLRKSLDILPDDIRRHLRRYNLIRLLPVVFLLVMISVGLMSNVIGASQAAA
jgi:hypothetical protein